MLPASRTQSNLVTACCIAYPMSTTPTAAILTQEPDGTPGMQSWGKSANKASYSVFYATCTDFAGRGAVLYILVGICTLRRIIERMYTHISILCLFPQQGVSPSRAMYRFLPNKPPSSILFRAVPEDCFVHILCHSAEPPVSNFHQMSSFGSRVDISGGPFIASNHYYILSNYGQEND